jgi:hypothetical protein
MLVCIYHKNCNFSDRVRIYTLVPSSELNYPTTMKQAGVPRGGYNGEGASGGSSTNAAGAPQQPVYRDNPE